MRPVAPIVAPSDPLDVPPLIVELAESIEQEKESNLEQTQLSERRFSILELKDRWNISDAGVRWRLKNIGKVETMPFGFTIRESEVEMIEEQLKAKGLNPTQSNSMEVLNKERSRPRPVPVETTEHVSPPRVARLRIALEHIALATEKNNPAACAIARLALEMDAVEG